MVFERRIPLLLCALAGGCIDPPERADAGTAEREPTAAADERAEAAPPTDASPTPAKPKPAPAATGERAYVNVENVGVHVLDERGFHQLARARGPVHDMLVHEGRLFLLASYGVVEQGENGQANTLINVDANLYRELGAPRAFGTIDGEHFWIAGAGGVGRPPEGGGGEWEITKLEELRGDARPRALSLAVDHEGKPWLTWGELHRHEDAGWTTVPVGPGIPPAIYGLRADLRAKAMFIYGGCTQGADSDRCMLVRKRDDEVARFDFPVAPCRDYSLLTLSSSGRFAALGSACGVVRVDTTKPGAPELFTIASGGWTGASVRGLAIDDGGRLWVGTPDGLEVIDAAGERTELPIGQLSQLTGALSGLVVTGGGPALPELGRHNKGGLAATLVINQDGARNPVPNAKVSLCRKPLPQVEAGQPRCAGAEDAIETQTNEKGEMRVENVPIGYYVIDVELDGSWREAVPKALNMRAGMTGNVGKIPISLR